MNRRELVTELNESFGVIKRCIALRHLPGGSHIDLNKPQLEVLFFLNCTPSHMASIKELMDITQTTSSAVTQLVETLEKHGYVERRHSSDDRRVVLVHFTGRGKEKLNTLHQHLTEMLLKLTEPLTDEELQILVTLHKKIAGQARREQHGSVRKKDRYSAEAA